MGGLGLRRRALRAEIDGWITSPGPWKGHIHWAGRNRLVTDASAGPQMLDFDGVQLALVFAALKLADDNAASSTRQEQLSLLRNRLAHALPVPQRQLLALTLLPEAPGLEGAEPAALAYVLAAIKGWRRLHLRYSAANGAVSERTVWPIILHYADTCLIAWCELRNEQRSFRLDRMIEVTVLPDARAGRSVGRLGQAPLAGLTAAFSLAPRPPIAVPHPTRSQRRTRRNVIGRVLGNSAHLP